MDSHGPDRGPAILSPRAPGNQPRRCWQQVWGHLSAASVPRLRASPGAEPLPPQDHKLSAKWKGMRGKEGSDICEHLVVLMKLSYKIFGTLLQIKSMTKTLFAWITELWTVFWATQTFLFTTSNKEITAVNTEGITLTNHCSQGFGVRAPPDPIGRHHGNMSH